jgi:deazaflavin-dependent oxidoreductase (nitroreductase family)
MSEMTDWNTKIIEEFRANEGQVGGSFAGAPIALVHHLGRKSGRAYVIPVMYLPDDSDDDLIYIFATRGGDASNPDWYYNLTAAGETSIERGTDSFPVSVRELSGDQRDRVYAEQARRYPAFAEYAKQTRGIRTIPVLLLRRVVTLAEQGHGGADASSRAETRHGSCLAGGPGALAAHRDTPALDHC